MSDYHANALHEALRSVAGHAGLQPVIARAGRNAAALAAHLQQAVIAEVREFSTSRNPELLPDVQKHCREIVDELLRLLRGGRVGHFGFVREHARRRAEQRFPLEATLHAYRSGHKLVSRWLRDAVLAAKLPAATAQQASAAIVDFSMEFVDALSTTYAASYTAQALLLAEVAGDRRSELLRMLLSGHDEADQRAARLLREAGFLEERQHLCVTLARSVDPTEMLDTSRARRMADAIGEIVAALGVRRVIDVHDNKVTLICAAVSRDSGWTAPRTSLAKRIHAAMNQVGNAALIGISNDVPSTAHVPGAHRAAASALALATVTRRVVQFADIPLRQLLLHFGAPELARVLPPWAAQLASANERGAGALSATLRAYAEQDMNILKAAEVLGVHPNTIYARFERIHDLTGLQPRSFESLQDLLIVCDCGQA